MKYGLLSAMLEEGMLVMRMGEEEIFRRCEGARRVEEEERKGGKEGQWKRAGGVQVSKCPGSGAQLSRRQKEGGDFGASSGQIQHETGCRAQRDGQTRDRGELIGRTWSLPAAR